jgi:hypothetical protein
MRATLDSRRGQTLVEALIALSILTMGFMGILALLTKSFELNRVTTEDAQATYLASEGIEIAKNLIDHDVYEKLSGNVNYGWGNCFSRTGYYYPIDYSTVDCTSPSMLFSASNVPADRTPLYYDAANHVFTANSFGAQRTGFVRTIEVTNSADGEAVDVQSTVSWTDAGSANQITLEDHFYNWHP